MIPNEIHFANYIMCVDLDGVTGDIPMWQSFSCFLYKVDSVSMCVHEQVVSRRDGPRLLSASSYLI